VAIHLPDGVPLYPAHGPGSPCGANICDRQSTIGHERRHNPALQFTDESGFIDWVLRTAPPMPRYYPRMKRINAEGPEILNALPTVEWLEPVAFQRHVAAGDVQLIDNRSMQAFDIQALERAIASRLVQTPYILLLSFPGINVVSAADFAGEMGPVEHYANAKAITGRAGLRPSRYQSDQVDKANGPLVRLCNHALRAAILGIADNLIVCNPFPGPGYSMGQPREGSAA
jgi:hypothetical protein